MPSVFATLVAVAAAAVLLRVAVGRLTAAEQLQPRGRTESISEVRAEFASLHRTLCDARERAASGDGA